MSDLPIALEATLGDAFSRALDVEGKIPRALEALGPIVSRDVVFVGGGPLDARLVDAGARVICVDPFLPSGRTKWPVPDAAADAVVAGWTGFRGIVPAEVAEAERVLRPGGRLLILHDYGRDDVSRLRGDQPEYSEWSRRNGPFLSAGFKIRVIHCFWTFESIEAARSFLAGAFGAIGEQVGAALTRPRLSYNVAVYHRTVGGDAATA